MPAAKKKKPTTKKQPALRLRVLQAGMDLIAEKGWAELALEDVARRCRVTLAEVQRVCPDKISLLRILGEEVDAAMVADEVGEGTVRDLLFDLIMRRFDALEPWREGVVSLVRSWLSVEPLLPFTLRNSFARSVSLTLEAAGVNPTPLRVAGLGIVAASVLHVWCEDESADKSKTMAALDKRLEQLERAAERFNPFCPR